MAVSPKPRAQAGEPVQASRPADASGPRSTPAERAFRTLSDEPVRELYTAADLAPGAGAGGPEDPIGLPGEYPFTRGIHPTMYRGQLWTMRQFAGFGTSEETNERFHYLLEHGQTGLSTAFDMPSLMGHDSDHAALARRGRTRGRSHRHARRHADALLRHRPRRGVRVDDDQRPGRHHARVLRRRRRVRRGGARGAGSTSGVGPVPAERLSGTIQADILKEYIAQKEWCFPIDPAMRLCGDMIEWCTRRMPRWHPISISGYHIREAGSTAQQELAFTLKDGLTYVEQAVARGLRRRRLRPASVVLLQRPDRLLRGDRQVPCRPAHLGEGDARDLRRQEPALLADALPRADRRRLRSPPSSR